jgi:hypothetical protein
MATAQLKPIAKDFYLDTALATLIGITFAGAEASRGFRCSQ